MSKGFCLAVLTLIVLSLAPGDANAKSAAASKSAPVTITLTPSLASPQKLGTSIVWTAAVQNAPSGHTFEFQFSVASLSENLNQIVRDFSPTSSFTWVPYKVEGMYGVVVKARDITQIPFTVYPAVVVEYEIMPWSINGGISMVHQTSHPLVALFSAPPCTAGHFMLVRFRQSGASASSTTNSVACSQYSANFYVAGMLPLTQYMMHWEEYGPNFAGSAGTDLVFQTLALPSGFLMPPMRVNVPPTAHDALFPVVLFHFISPTAPIYWPTATDLAGNVIWFYPGAQFMARIEPGGNFFSISGSAIREFDLVGNETLETNVNVINQQLAAKGYPTITQFNTHEVRRLPNGNILTIGARDVVSTSAQGGTPANPVDIIGDTILILDRNLQVVWEWDSFAHQDITRAATLGDTCAHKNPGCPEFNPNFTVAKDWLHSNSVAMAADGNIILSERSQDWVIKVNYQNGNGDGSVLWRLGAFGDFTILNPPTTTCGDPNVFPWFTHQHDAAFQFEANNTGNGLKIFTLFDDGNTRHQQCGNSGNSRGMVLFMGEATRTIYIKTSADLGQYSFAVGSAQMLITGPSTPDGKNLFASYDNGILNLPGHTSQSTEVDLSGNIVYQLEAASWSYRTYRMQDLYTPTLP